MGEIKVGVTQVLKNLSNNYRNLMWWRQIIIKYAPKVVYRKKDGFSVLSENWDHLIILDACRFDVFSEEIKKSVLYKKGKLEYRISNGSMTLEFLSENFGEGVFNEIVYITANPFVDMLLKNKFYKIISVWKDGWDNNLNTVHPRTVYEYTKLSIKKYSDKRFIIHFMQPHFPYLTLKLAEETGFAKHREAVLRGAMKWKDKTVWDLVEEGRIPLEVVVQAYRKNLEIALKYVEKLVKILDGKIVITSDHGEAFGEKFHPIIPIKVYGHPKNVRIDALVKVPWFVINKPKKKIVNDEKQKLSIAISKFLQKNLSLVKPPQT